MELDFQDGQLVEVVKSTRALELSELEQLVQSAEAELTAANEAKAAHDAQAEELNQKVSTAQANVDQAKSTLARGNELVGQAASGVDTGAESPSSELAEPTAETAEPAENLF